MYLLDTNTCVFLIKNKPARVLDILRSVLTKSIFVSSITVAELQFGVYNSGKVKKNRISFAEFLAPFQILDFDGQDAEWYGKIRAQLKKEGNLIGPYDLLIASQALAKGLVLVTNNTNEFSRVEGLKIEDWK